MNTVPATLATSQLCASNYGHRFRWLCDRRADSEPIGADALPLLNQHAAGFEESTNAGALPSRNFFENGRQHCKSAGAQHRALGDLRNMRRFRNRDGESVASVDLEHHVDI